MKHGIIDCTMINITNMIEMLKCRETQLSMSSAVKQDPTIRTQARMKVSRTDSALTIGEVK